MALWIALSMESNNRLHSESNFALATSKASKLEHLVNAPVSERELEALRICVNRGQPYGDEQWTEKIAEQQGVWHTLRPISRPRKQVKPHK